MSLYQAILDETAPGDVPPSTIKLADRTTVWQLDSPSGFAAKVTDGRAAVFVCEKAGALTLDALKECCAPFGVGEAVECTESQYLLAIGLLDDTALLVLGADADVTAAPVEFSPPATTSAASSAPSTTTTTATRTATGPCTSTAPSCGSRRSRTPPCAR